MPRYVKQTDLFRCGPIVVANVMKWAGVNYSWTKNKKKLTKLCVSEPNAPDIHPRLAGTSQQQIDKALRKTCGDLLRIRRALHPALKHIDKHLDGGNAVALFIVYMDKHNNEKFTNSHIFLCIGRTPFYYTTVNLGMDVDTVCRVHRSTIKALIRQPRYYYSAWFLTKRK